MRHFDAVMMDFIYHAVSRAVIRSLNGKPRLLYRVAITHHD